MARFASMRLILEGSSAPPPLVFEFEETIPCPIWVLERAFVCLFVGVKEEKLLEHPRPFLFLCFLSARQGPMDHRSEHVKMHHAGI